MANALLHKGMKPDENHHTMYRKQIDGVTTLVTRISHGATTIDNGLGRRMGAQCGLQLREFWDLVDCTLDEAGWDAIVRQRFIGGRNPYLHR